MTGAWSDNREIAENDGTRDVALYKKSIRRKKCTPGERGWKITEIANKYIS